MKLEGCRATCGDVRVLFFWTTKNQSVENGSDLRTNSTSESPTSRNSERKWSTNLEPVSTNRIICRIDSWIWKYIGVNKLIFVCGNSGSSSQWWKIRDYAKLPLIIIITQISITRYMPSQSSSQLQWTLLNLWYIPELSLIGYTPWEMITCSCIEYFYRLLLNAVGLLQSRGWTIFLCEALAQIFKRKAIRWSTLSGKCEKAKNIAMPLRCRSGNPGTWFIVISFLFNDFIVILSVLVQYFLLLHTEIKHFAIKKPNILLRDLNKLYQLCMKINNFSLE